MSRSDEASDGASLWESNGGKASDRASPPKVREGEVHDGTSPWEFQGV